MTKKTYPEDIYKDFPTCGSEQSNIAAHAAGRQHAYNMGFNNGYFARHQANPLAGWSNLTEAIKTGERIDWDALDGLEAQCVHPELGIITYKLERNGNFPPAKYSAWYKTDFPSIWIEALIKSWLGLGGWSLWVKGDIPLRKLTADQLEPGTCFRARYQKGALNHTYARAQVVQVRGETRVVCFNEYFSYVLSTYRPANIEVLEVYGVGTFQTPKENA